MADHQIGPLVRLAALLGTSLLSVPAFADPISYNNGEDRTAPIVLTDPTTVLVVNGSATATQSGAISESGGSWPVAKDGTGTLVLTARNTYTGTTRIDAGTLVLATGATLAGPVANSGTFISQGSVAGLVTNLGTLVAGGFPTSGLNGGLTNSGTATVSNRIPGTLTNLAGTVTLTQLPVVDRVVQSPGATLIIEGLDGAFGSLTGDGTLDLRNARFAVGSNNSSSTFGGVISGSNRFSKVGTGTLSLSGTNTLGRVFINGGTLSLTSAGFLSGEVNNDATFVSDGKVSGTIFNSGTLTSTGVINGNVSNSGTAKLAGQLNGALVNNGTVALAGVTTGITTLTQLNSATFNLAGYNTTIGSLAGTGFVELGSGTLTTNGDNSSTTFSGVISGAGGITKAGAATLTLANANSYTGTTTVTAGTLALTAGGTLAGPVANAATFTNAGTVAGLFTNTGTLTSGGLLNGGLTNSGIATLAGQVNGMLTVQNGGRVSPGTAGIGTLTVNGNVAFQDGSTYLAEITPAAADLISISGSAQLAGSLAVANLGGEYSVGTSYVLLSAAGGRTGTFTSATGLNLGNQYRAQIIYTPTQVQLLISPNLLAQLVGSAGLTPNAASFVSAYDAAVLGGLNTKPFDALYSLSGASLASAVHQLSGTFYPTMVRATGESERLITDVALGRLRSLHDLNDDGRGVWLQALRSWTNVDTDGNAPTFVSDTKGFAGGIDGTGKFLGGGDFRAGVFLHYAQTDVHAAAVASSAQLNRFGGGTYLGLSFGALQARLGVALSEVDVDVTRRVVFSGFTNTLSGHPNGTARQGFGELAYHLPLGATSFIEPVAMVSLVRLKLRNMIEDGGAARLHIADRDNEFGNLLLGLRAGTALPMGDGALHLSGRAGGLYKFGDRGIMSRAALDLAPLQPFTIQSAAIDDWSLLAGLDLSMSLGRAVTSSLSYSGVLGPSSKEHSAKATLGVSF